LTAKAVTEVKAIAAPLAPIRAVRQGDDAHTESDGSGV